MIQICKYKCSNYRVTSILCNSYQGLCASYPEISFKVNRLEVVDNAIDDYYIKERADKGLKDNDSIQLIKLEKEKEQLERALERVGVEYETE